MQTQAHEQLTRSLATALMRISQMEVDICHQTEEIAAVRAVAESTKKDLSLTQVRLSEREGFWAIGI
jgi:uncharacterized protein with PhoU and TrkA domain